MTRNVIQCKNRWNQVLKERYQQIPSPPQQQQKRRQKKQQPPILKDSILFIPMAEQQQPISMPERQHPVRIVEQQPQVIQQQPQPQLQSQLGQVLQQIQNHLGIPSSSPEEHCFQI